MKLLYSVREDCGNSVLYLQRNACEIRSPLNVTNLASGTASLIACRLESYSANVVSSPRVRQVSSSEAKRASLSGEGGEVKIAFHWLPGPSANWGTFPGAANGSEWMSLMKSARTFSCGLDRRLAFAAVCCAECSALSSALHLSYINPRQQVSIRQDRNRSAAIRFFARFIRIKFRWPRPRARIVFRISCAEL